MHVSGQLALGFHLCQVQFLTEEVGQHQSVFVSASSLKRAWSFEALGNVLIAPHVENASNG